MAAVHDCGEAFLINRDQQGAEDCHGALPSIDCQRLARAVQLAARKSSDLLRILPERSETTNASGVREGAQGSGLHRRPYYRIGDASRIVGVSASTLRSWEKQVLPLRSVRRRNGRRYYSPHQLSVACAIHRLCTQEGYTLEGACKQLGSLQPPSRQSGAVVPGDEVLLSCRELIEALEKILHVCQYTKASKEGELTRWSSPCRT